MSDPLWDDFNAADNDAEIRSRLELTTDEALNSLVEIVAGMLGLDYEDAWYALIAAQRVQEEAD